MSINDSCYLRALDPDVLTEIFSLRGRGGGKPKVINNYLSACCPFPHKKENGIVYEKNPSFGINIFNGSYNCFSCGRSGPDIYHLAKNLSIPEQEVAAKIRFVPAALTGRVSTSPDGYILDIIRRNRDKASDYLKARGIFYAEKLAEIYNIGASADGKEIYFPLSDDTDQFAGWTTRYTEGDIRWKIFPEGVKKGNLFFGGEGYMKKDEPGTYYLTESVMDTLTLIDSGKNSFSTLGAVPASEQLMYFLTKAERLILVAQNDESGKAWEEKIISRLRNRITIIKLLLPAEVKGKKVKDLNEFKTMFVKKNGMSEKSSDIFRIFIEKIPAVLISSI